MPSRKASKVCGECVHGLKILRVELYRGVVYLLGHVVANC